MRVINLIPENYEGNPREAIGYCWDEVVTTEDGYGIDRSLSSPGEDLHLSLNACLDMLEEVYGLIVMRKYNNFGPGETRDGLEKQISDDAQEVAFINGMWCGGPMHRIYRLTNCVEMVKEPVEDTEDQEKSFGWCDECQSYCYGDCGAN